MKTIRWFLSHFFLVLLVVVVIYGYMYWGNLAGKDTPAGKAIAYLSSEFVEVDEFIKAVKAKQAQLSAEHTSVETKQAPEVVAEAKIENVQSDVVEKQPAEPSVKIVEEKPVAIDATVELEEKTALARNIEQQPVSISYSHNQMRVTQNSTGQISSQSDAPSQAEVATASDEPETQAEPVAAPTAEKNVAEPETVAVIKQESVVRKVTPLKAPSRAVAATVSKADNFVSPKIEQQLNNVDKNGKVINQAIKTYAIRDSWITARKSFYQRKYELSEKSYREVINSTTDNFDAYGELGNVYFNQGKNTEAAAAYFEAASIMVRKGQLNRARSLMGVLRHLDDSKAVELKKLIDSSAS